MSSLSYQHKYDLAKFANPSEGKFPARILVVMNGVFDKESGKDLPCRHVSKDMEVLRTIFNQLGLTKHANSVLCIKQNLLEEQMHDFFYQESQNPKLKDFGMLIVILMSHGFTGHIYDKDQKMVEVDKLMENFRGSKCTALFGKPKLVIVQACEVEYLPPKLPRYRGLGGRVEADSGSSWVAENCCMPSEADFLIVWSPISGNVFWRDSEKDGSLFISKFKKVLDDPESEGMEVRKMMTRAIQLVCEELEEWSPKGFAKSGFRLPYTIDMFTKELYFHTAKITMTSDLSP